MNITDVNIFIIRIQRDSYTILLHTYQFDHYANVIISHSIIHSHKYTIHGTIDLKLHPHFLCVVSPHSQVRYIP